MSKMFCYQCQETSKNEGCTVKGVCGKTADVANMQDLTLSEKVAICGLVCGVVDNWADCYLIGAQKYGDLSVNRNNLRPIWQDCCQCMSKFSGNPLLRGSRNRGIIFAKPNVRSFW